MSQQLVILLGGLGLCDCLKFQIAAALVKLCVTMPSSTTVGQVSSLIWVHVPYKAVFGESCFNAANVVSWQGNVSAFALR